ncbi:hypothetical protein D0Z06_23395 [Geodermatophilus marinus]|nr:hypothetical protein D0Z06_23395 [Geodermatophilus sp. LHW52908]
MLLTAPPAPAAPPAGPAARRTRPGLVTRLVLLLGPHAATVEMVVGAPVGLRTVCALRAARGELLRPGSRR